MEKDGKRKSFFKQMPILRLPIIVGDKAENKW